MDTLTSLERTKFLGQGLYREVFATHDPLWVRKVNRGNGNANRVEFETKDSIPESPKFRVAQCFLAGDGTTDLIMERIHGHVVAEGGVDKLTIQEMYKFWYMIEDLHLRNVMVDDEGVIWLVDYAGMVDDDYSSNCSSSW